MATPAILIFPLPRSADFRFLGARETSAMSLSWTIIPSDSLITISSNSSGWFSLPKVRMVNSVRAPSIFPEGNSKFCWLRAFLTSRGVRP